MPPGDVGINLHLPRHIDREHFLLTSSQLDTTYYLFAPSWGLLPLLWMRESTNIIRRTDTDSFFYATCSRTSGLRRKAFERLAFLDTLGSQETSSKPSVARLINECRPQSSQSGGFRDGLSQGHGKAPMVRWLVDSLHGFRPI